MQNYEGIVILVVNINVFGNPDPIFHVHWELNSESLMKGNVTFR